MALYEYRAINKETGARVTDKVEIDDMALFLQDMNRQGLLVTSVKKTGSGELFGGFFRRSTVSKVDKGMAMMELGAFLKAGIPLKTALERLASEAPKGVGAPIRASAESLEQGMSFSQAVSAHKALFDEWEVQAIEAAEASGTLAESLTYIGEQALKSHDFDSKVKSAMIYPAFVMVVVVAVILLMLFFVIPAFSDMLGTENLPRSTIMLLGLSNFMRANWLWILCGLILAFVIARRLLKKEDTEGFSERIALKIPGWGRILRNSYLVRFGKTFATLLESGARVLPALEYSGQATGSALYIKASSDIRKEVERGGRIGDSMRKTGVFPALFCELAAAGESSGTLPEMVSKAASFYEGEVNRMLSSLSSLVEPILIAIVGVIVGFLAITILGPILR
ncbi:MAG: type II secretion system F family protein, partial [Bacillota bacterium]